MSYSSGSISTDRLPPLGHFVAAVIFLACAACDASRNPPAAGTDALARFEANLDRGEFLAAYLAWDKVRPQLEQEDESIAGHAYNQLCGRAAGIGQREWPAIFASQDIRLDLKLDLIREIDEIARRSATP